MTKCAVPDYQRISCRKNLISRLSDILEFFRHSNFWPKLTRSSNSGPKLIVVQINEFSKEFNKTFKQEIKSINFEQIVILYGFKLEISKTKISIDFMDSLFFVFEIETSCPDLIFQWKRTNSTIPIWSNLTIHDLWSINYGALIKALLF